MIIDKDDLEIWMIALLDREDVIPIRQIALDSWYDQGFTINLFNAITPADIPTLSVKLNLTRKEKHIRWGGPVEFSETEKAIWYSHFYLWEHCIKVNKPICIIEEDCQLIQKFPEFILVDKMVAFCWDTRGVTPAAGYILSVDTAKYLHNLTLTQKLSYNVDHLLIKNVDKKNKRFLKDLATQVPRNWRTIEHW